MISTLVTYGLIPVIIIYIYSLFSKKMFRLSGYYLLILGFLLMIEVIVRSIEIRFPALTSLFECLIFLSGITLIVDGVLIVRDKLSPGGSFGITIGALIFLLIALSPLAPNSLQPPIPALQSNWLLLHVSFSFIGEAFFLISFIMAIILLKNKCDKHYTLMIKSIYIGYPFYLSGAIVFGAIWASSAWGSFWSWDPKEIWALVTILIYTLLLHLRLKVKLGKKREAIIVITAFLSSMFTLFGVNFLLEGLHSYR